MGGYLFPGVCAYRERNVAVIVSESTTCCLQNESRRYHVTFHVELLESILYRVMYNCWQHIYRVLLIGHVLLIRQKKKIYIYIYMCVCVFQVSRPYLGFCPDPKHFIVNCEQNVVKFAGNEQKCIEKCSFNIKDRPYLGFSELKHTHFPPPTPHPR